jgi:hypothetical protein
MWRLRAKKHLHGLHDSDDVAKCLDALNAQDAEIGSRYTLVFAMLVLVAGAFGAAWHHGGIGFSWPILPAVVLLSASGVALLVGLRHVPARTMWHFTNHEDRVALAERRARQIVGRATILWISIAALTLAVVPVAYGFAATFPGQGLTPAGDADASRDLADDDVPTTAPMMIPRSTPRLTIEKRMPLRAPFAYSGRTRVHHRSTPPSAGSGSARGIAADR